MTRDSITKVALFGASGNLGGHLLNALVKASFQVTVVCRPESKLKVSSIVTEDKLPWITTIHVPFDDEEGLTTALAGHDTVVVAIARGNAIRAQRTIINAAVKAGVHRFIPSEFGADTLCDELIANVPLMSEKRAILEHLQEVSSKFPSFHWTAISNAAFLDWGLETGFLGFNIPNQTATIYSCGTKLFNATTRSTVAAAVVASLQRPATENKYLYVADITTSQSEILAILQDQTAKQWTVIEKEAKAEHAKGTLLWEQGDIPGAARHWLIGNLYGSGKGTLVEQLDNESLGLKGMKLEDVVAELLAKT